MPEKSQLPVEVPEIYGTVEKCRGDALLVRGSRVISGRKRLDRQRCGMGQCTISGLVFEGSSRRRRNFRLFGCKAVGGPLHMHTAPSCSLLNSRLSYISEDALACSRRRYIMWSSLELPAQLSHKRSWRLAPIHGEFVQTDTSL